ncbi:MAG TPA: type II toxin-antitoxin system RelE/ParE family toxin [Solirubrobacteraceae bacterium]|nr:type II toxin-antitoxin system RelE/ParE family toxin [Solirubrobacteraceae bacterium]
MTYGARPSWEIEFTPEAERWFMGLSHEDANRIAATFDELERRGPGLGRPFVDSIKGSRHHHMKEVRSVGGHLRALVAFDPRRQAIVLVGGDKTGNWKGWYARNIARADALYDRHLRDLGEGGRWGTAASSTRRAGTRSEASGR